jgi:DNA-directed RNA polymerase subunit K/omega
MKKASTSKVIVADNSTVLKDERPKNWFWDYNDIFESGLSAYAKLVRLYLARCSSGESRQAWPSLNTMAKRCGCSKPTVKRAISELEEKKWLRKISRTTLNGEHMSNIYILTRPDTEADVDDDGEQEGGGFSQNPPGKNITASEDEGGFSQNLRVKNSTAFEDEVGSDRTQVGSERPYLGSEVYPNNTNITILNNTTDIHKDLKEDQVTTPPVVSVGRNEMEIPNQAPREINDGVLDSVIQHAGENGLVFSSEFARRLLTEGGFDVERVKNAIVSVSAYLRTGVKVGRLEGLLINAVRNKFGDGEAVIKGPEKNCSEDAPDKYEDIYCT